ncbi:uncharacterized protein EI90DRAFT_453265 [Cantharellus anzutake]|uniref:uncharacterized protein n=1 Tax=Cantharellus anzutake TaxID=1750568 RepID=UPI001905CE50|nr:uncharacterized protein EI90DRAFT_453265 [Cantharellus anzutake]KAF8334691.1 hypothetical protein EI90DRAFT_453265 [Cantharellus anzutake]
MILSYKKYVLLYLISAIISHVALFFFSKTLATPHFSETSQKYVLFQSRILIWEDVYTRLVEVRRSTIPNVVSRCLSVFS